MIATLAFGTTTVPTGTSINAPQEPNLFSAQSFLVSFEYICVIGRKVEEPNNRNITADTFSYFAHKEVHVWTAHADAYDRYGCTLEATSDSQESAF